ncbi:MAG: hypothetical protein H7096_09595 [Flavobacterium sp.]|nr:hypothetical protein [Pedobacter sp.]
MLKRNFSIFMISLAGMILLGHNFVPHHHPEAYIEFSNSIQDKHQHPDENVNPLSYLFSLYQHHDADKEIKTHVTVSYSFQLKTDNFFASSQHFAFKAVSQIPGIDDPPEIIHAPIFSLHPCQVWFRGPPIAV